MVAIRGPEIGAFSTTGRVLGGSILMFDPSQPPLVQETLLKKRRSLDDLAYRRSVTVQQEVKVLQTDLL